jgi:hypothetical protein
MLTHQQCDDAQSIIGDAAALGIELQAYEGAVRYRPKNSMPLDLYHRLREHRLAVLELLEREAAEIAWRVAAMCPKVPKTGPIPFLVAREWGRTTEIFRRCLSCGDTLDEGRTVRCALCVAAVEMVLNEMRDGA